ncbi:MAG: hypothetical protein V1735_05100 [Nanoarchaeota archaeon]
MRFPERSDDKAAASLPHRPGSLPRQSRPQTPLPTGHPGIGYLKKAGHMLPYCTSPPVAAKAVA